MKKITVYYASPDNLQETQDWSILYKEPTSLNKYLSKNINKERSSDVQNRGFMSCTAYKGLTNNTYVIENPIDSSYTLDGNMQST